MKRRHFLGIGASHLPWFGSPLATAADRAPAPKSLVTVLLAGGMSHIDSFDPKPQAPAEIRGEFGTVASSVPSVHFSELFPKLAQSFHLFALLRGVSHTTPVHDTAQRLMLTSSSNPRANTPSIASIAAQQTREFHNAVPAYAAIPMLATDAGELGQQYEPFNLLGDGGDLLQKVPAKNDRQAWSSFNDRVELLEVLEKYSETSAGLSSAQERASVYQRAVAAMESDVLKQITQIDQESSETIELYGDSEIGRYLLYARRLLEAGTRCITVTCGGWDTHYDAYPTLRKQIPSTDWALAGFLNDLSQRGLLASTMVAVVTDFGRTPEISAEGGRGHWPQAGVGLLAGGRFQGGVCLGATDASGAAVVDGRCTPQDIGCTLLEELGIPTRATFLPPTGRAALPEGRVLREIIAG